MTRIPAAIVGTGMVGQRFVQLLANHPWFEPVQLVGRTAAGKTLGEIWVLPEPVPAELVDLRVTDRVRDAAAAFSALPAEAAAEIEPQLAGDGIHVFTNASAHRMHPHVPLLIGDINPDHLPLVNEREWPGMIVANPNCSAVVLTTALAPLHRAFGIDAVEVTTLQSLSGAGYPGVPSLDITGNVIPLIPNEEGKIEAEPCRILGTLKGGAIEPAPIRIRATATRVPVPEGHTAVAHVTLRRAATAQDVARALREFSGPDGLPSAPRYPVAVTVQADGPQPRRDAMAGNGMVVTVGRIRAEGHHVRLVAHGSNTVRGAAGCSVMNAELACRDGYLKA